MSPRTGTRTPPRAPARVVAPPPPLELDPKVVRRARTLARRLGEPVVEMTRSRTTVSANVDNSPMSVRSIATRVVATIATGWGIGRESGLVDAALDRGPVRAVARGLLTGLLTAVGLCAVVVAIALVSDASGYAALSGSLLRTRLTRP